MKSSPPLGAKSGLGHWRSRFWTAGREAPRRSKALNASENDPHYPALIQLWPTSKLLIIQDAGILIAEVIAEVKL
jgi:hypothetical protein